MHESDPRLCYKKSSPVIKRGVPLSCQGSDFKGFFDFGSGFFKTAVFSVLMGGRHNLLVLCFKPSARGFRKFALIRPAPRYSRCRHGEWPWNFRGQEAPLESSLVQGSLLTLGLYLRTDNNPFLKVFLWGQAGGHQLRGSWRRWRLESFCMCAGVSPCAGDKWRWCSRDTETTAAKGEPVDSRRNRNPPKSCWDLGERRCSPPSRSPVESGAWSPASFRVSFFCIQAIAWGISVRITSHQTIYSHVIRAGNHLCGSVGEESTCNAGDMGSTPGWENPLEEEMATHSSILGRKVPQTEVPGGLQSRGLKSWTQLSD